MPRSSKTPATEKTLRALLDALLLGSTHMQNTDIYLAYGTGNQVSAAELRAHLDDDTIHRVINDVVTSLTSLWSSEKISDELDLKLDLAGGLMSGFITLHADPVNAFHPVTKGYFDNNLFSLNWKHSVRASTTGALPAYTVSGGGTILTANANGALPAQDGITLLADERLLVKNESTTDRVNNGGYKVTQVGDAGTPWILTRMEDSNTSAYLLAATYRIREGATEANKVYAVNVAPIVMGTTELTLAQIAGAGTYANGTGILLTGNVFSLDTAYFSGAISALLTDNLTASRALSSDGSGKIVASAVTSTEQGYLSGVTSAIQTQINTKLTTSNYIPREIPSGAVDGVNTAFVLANTPIVGTESIFLRGIQQEPGTDYTILGNAITYLYAPETGDTLRVTYIKQ